MRCLSASGRWRKVSSLQVLKAVKTTSYLIKGSVECAQNGWCNSLLQQLVVPTVDAQISTVPTPSVFLRPFGSVLFDGLSMPPRYTQCQHRTEQ